VPNIKMELVTAYKSAAVACGDASFALESVLPSLENVALEAIRKNDGRILDCGCDPIFQVRQLMEAVHAMERCDCASRNLSQFER
jgi:hypothetical protein